MDKQTYNLKHFSYIIETKEHCITINFLLIWIFILILLLGGKRRLLVLKYMKKEFTINSVSCPEICRDINSVTIFLPGYDKVQDTCTAYYHFK